MFEKMLEGIDMRLGVSHADVGDIADRTVYTGMLDEFYGYRFGRLEYRSLRFETKTLDCPNHQGNAVVNYTDRDTPYTRVIEHKHFEYAQTPKTVITMEYPKEFGRGDEPYYPVNDGKNNEIYQKYRELADREGNVLFGGRLAEYKYCDMWQVVRGALDMARRVM
jgi:UDP-galactopyranose mutase